MNVARIALTFILAAIAASAHAQSAADLRPNYAFHAFDHLGGEAHQAEAAAKCGVTILYASGIGGDGYSGLPAPESFDQRKRAESEYARSAKAGGIRTVLGYVCATSIVGLDKFDANWTPEMRAEFGTPPAQWLQQDRHGDPLPSWYEGEYRPACMSNPGWRAYERFIVRQQLETGHDGIFFDNPTVHPKGCYCIFCMTRFETFLLDRAISVVDHSIEGLRRTADERPVDFAAFRCTIARDFLAEMRAYARSINPEAIVTANNSLNSASVLYAQCRSYAYNIFEMSKSEDLVVVEDMSSQPRVDAKGATIEYGPTYRQLAAVVHGRPLVAVTIAEADYHTPPNLMRLAMAEAAAHGASYLAWPTWPQDARAKMIAGVRPQADWLRAHADLLNATDPRADVLLFLPFRRWQDTDKCAASDIASQLTKANIQYGVICEDALTAERLARARAFVLEDRSVPNESESRLVDAYESTGGKVIVASGTAWMEAVRGAVADSLHVAGPPELRVVVRDSAAATAICVYNLNVKRLSSFEDEVHPAANARISVTTPFPHVESAIYTTADRTGDESLHFDAEPMAGGTRVAISVPEIAISGMIIIMPGK